ncbi:hypothetical protein [Anaeromassilibacillus senegalensis]|uniref:hypothetical protein n=1 Tax=Anaeromassilibacillus senegalensis TaxID=1673717 RepID=UPI0006809145|nr:hypothetical protein [Anaeromassilibacillus senegalensis]
MDKKSNHPHDDFSVEEILQEARRLREQQGEEAAPATEADVPPAPQRAQAVPVLRTEMPAPSHGDARTKPGPGAGTPGAAAQGSGTRPKNGRAEDACAPKGTDGGGGTAGLGAGGRRAC